MWMIWIWTTASLTFAVGFGMGARYPRRPETLSGSLTLTPVLLRCCDSTSGTRKLGVTYLGRHGVQLFAVRIE